MNTAADRYVLEMSSDDGNLRTFVFCVDSQTGRGWTKLKLLEVSDTVPQRRMTWQEEESTPGSYFNQPWSARAAYFADGGRTYELYGAFGTPGGRLLLIPAAPN